MKFRSECGIREARPWIGRPEAQAPWEEHPKHHPCAAERETYRAVSLNSPVALAYDVAQWRAHLLRVRVEGLFADVAATMPR
jgi:hypothetical protein